MVFFKNCVWADVHQTVDNGFILDSAWVPLWMFSAPSLTEAKKFYHVQVPAMHLLPPAPELLYDVVWDTDGNLLHTQVWTTLVGNKYFPFSAFGADGPEIS